MLDKLASTLPGGNLAVSADGGYATKAFLRDLSDNIGVSGRFSIASKLYELPGSQPRGKRGPKPKKGALIGTPKRCSVKQAGKLILVKNTRG